MNLTAALTIGAAVFGLVQVIPYVRSILKGRTKPSRVACLIWLLMDCVTFAGLVAVGFSGAAWLTLVFIITQLVVVGLLPKYGVGGKSRFDLICFAIGICAIIGWVIIQQKFGQAYGYADGQVAPAGQTPVGMRYGAMFAVVLTTTAVAVANVNMLRKLIRLPLSEDVLAWALTIVAGGLTIIGLIVGHSQWIDFVPPSLTFFTSSLVVGIQMVQKRRLEASGLKGGAHAA